MQTLAIILLNLVVCSAIYAGGISGGTGAKQEDLELSLQSLPKLPLEPECFSRLRMRLHANQGQAAMLIGTKSIDFKILAGRIINAGETFEVIADQNLNAYTSGKVE